MGKFGKGLTLAFFFTFIAFFSHAQEAVNGTGQAQGYPHITRLHWQDTDFRQYIAEVEVNRRRVFNRDRGNRDGTRISAQDLAESLTLYWYVPDESDSIFSLAARCSIPYSALASLNRLTSSTMVEAGRPLLLPSAPGIFVPQEPGSDLERLMASSRMSQADVDFAELTIEIEGGIVFYYFPGSDFNATERAFFLNPGFRFPLRTFRLTSSFGMRPSPFTGNMHFHEGIDLAAPVGTEVYAAGNGTVTDLGYDRILGNYVVIGHADNWASVYGHLQRIGTSLQSTVRSGTLIGWVGSTGLSTGPHLHFELRQHGRARDPDKYLFTSGGR